MTAERYVDRLLLVDGHCDSLILRQVRDDPMDLADVDAKYQVDLPRLRQGGMDCLWTMVGDSILTQWVILLDAAYEMCRHHPTDFAMCTTAGQVRAARAAEKIAIVLTIEGQKMFDENLAGLRNCHRLGVRVASITHGGGRRPELQYDHSFFGYITPTQRADMLIQSKGLTPFAFESLAEMARLGMAVDLAHINDVAFWQVMERAECPVCYTHGSCYALCPHSRALTDDMMRALAHKGGVMGIAFYRGFIDRERPSLERLCDHFIHALEVMGPDHVGIGTDFDGGGGVTGCYDVSEMKNITKELVSRGYSEDDIRKIWGGNLFSVMHKVAKLSKELNKPCPCGQ